MSTYPLMPKATAVWLIDNTALTFRQIADFCGLHRLEVKGIADGDVAQGIRGQDPIIAGELTRDELERAEKNEGYTMKIAGPKVELPKIKKKKAPKYTPTSRRQDRPNAILWLLRSHPELRPTQIIRLVGTTKPTIEAISDRTHWNSANLVPQDPVALGLCSQIDLDSEVKKAAARVERERAASGLPPEPETAGATLMPADEAIAGVASTPADPFAGMGPSSGSGSGREEEAAPDVDAVFADLGGKSRQAVEDESVPDADDVFGKKDPTEEDTASNT